MLLLPKMIMTKKMRTSKPSLRPMQRQRERWWLLTMRAFCCCFFLQLLYNPNNNNVFVDAFQQQHGQRARPGLVRLFPSTTTTMTMTVTTKPTLWTATTRTTTSTRQYPPHHPIATAAKWSFQWTRQSHYERSRRRSELQALSVATSSDNNDSNSILAKLFSHNQQAIVSALILVLLDIVFRRIFLQCHITFPPSLGGCCILFVTLLLVGINNNNNNKLYQVLSPGANLLAKWLPVFFVPSLVTLPLVGRIGSPMEVRKGSLFPHKVVVDPL
jgi:putative effector of murein hydrolase LrgA (UPF0299 family)